MSQDTGELAAQVDLLLEENRRLRREYTRARRATHRHTAIGLAGVGLLAALAGVLFPAAREVLFALAAIGFFGAVLTRYLTPERFVSATVSERVYATMADNHAALATALGLSTDPQYLPTGQLYATTEATTGPPPDATGPIIAGEHGRGLLLTATGAPLLEELEYVLTGSRGDTFAPLATQLAEGLVDHLELAAGVDIDINDHRATFAIDDPAFGDLARFDHPIVSVLACGIAMGRDVPTTASATPGDNRSDWLVTVRWDEHNSSR